MTSINPGMATGPLPQLQQLGATSTCPMAASMPSQAVGVGPSSSTDTAMGGGAMQAAQGAIPSTDQLAPVLQSLAAALQQLAAVLQQLPGAAGGGVPGEIRGAAGAPIAKSAPDATSSKAAASTKQSTKRATTAPATQPAARQPSGDEGKVEPSSVKDKASTKGLKPQSLAGLDVAHRYGLPLVSGYRSGGSSTSDHPGGKAIDVSTLAIGSAKSSGATPQMQAYAEHMRQEGKAGRLNVEYVISDGRIASARDNWSWRPYTYPGKTTGELEALKQSNRGEYNRIQHFDHVHVSFS